MGCDTGNEHTDRNRNRMRKKGCVLQPFFGVSRQKMTCFAYFFRYDIEKKCGAV